MSQWYYAHNGKQLGPVPVSELHRLAADGNFDLKDDLVWQEGMADWVPASTIPLIQLSSPAPYLKEASPNPEAAAPIDPLEPVDPYAAPSTWQEPAPDTDSSPPVIAPGSEPLDIGACISRGFELTKTHFVQILVIGIIVVGISMAVSAVMGFVDHAIGHAPQQLPASFGNPQIDEFIRSAADQGSILNRIVCGLVNTFLGLGVIRIGLNIVAGKPFNVEMLFSQRDKILRAFVAEFLFSLMVGLGLLLFIAPGIYLAARFGYYKTAIVDQNMGIIESFTYSGQLTENNRMPIVGLGIMLFLIVLAGFVALLVGLIFALPLTTLAWLVSYRSLRHGAGSIRG